MSWNRSAQNISGTGESLSQAFILASTHPQYDDRLLIELQFHYIQIPSVPPPLDYAHYITTCLPEIFKPAANPDYHLKKNIYILEPSRLKRLFILAQ